MTILKSIGERIRCSSGTQACGLTIIGVVMLISTIVAEAIEHAAVREAAQIGVIVVGFLATTVLFSPSAKDRHSNTRRQDAE
jgi:hypothetical protein